MDANKTAQLQRPEKETETDSIWTSGFDAKSGTTMMPPADPFKTEGPSPTSAASIASPEAQNDPDPETTLGRKDEERRRVDLDRNPDNPVYNRWQKNGEDSHYVATFHEKFKLQSVAFFGEELTQDEILAKIEEAKAAGDDVEAENLRMKLFSANEYAVVETLNSPSNAIYQKTATDTYCNIYAYDVVTAMGGYLPRVWWTDTVESQIESGELDENNITVKYAAGVTHEMRANMLNTWMKDHGQEFGWEKADSMKAAQEAANSGHLVIILASNKNPAKSGHVNVILPETEQYKSKTDDDGTTLPLQSQAGSVNFKHDTYTQAMTGSSEPKWWENDHHREGAAWICMGNPKSPILRPEQLGLAPTIEKDALKKVETDVEPTESPANVEPAVKD